MKKTNVLSKIVALSLSVICIVSVASMVHIVSSAASTNKADDTKVIATQYELNTANQLEGNLY